MKKLLITDLPKLVIGESQVISNIFIKNSVHILVSISKTAMYPIIRSDGKKCRSLGVINGEIKYATPEEDGFDPNYEENEYFFIGQIGDTLSLSDSSAKETISSFNIRKIDKDHPRYDNKLKHENETMIKLLKAVKNDFEQGD